MKYRNNIYIYDTKKEAFLTVGIFLVVGIAVDSFAVWRGYWNFQGPGLLGIKIGFLPIEEYALFLIAPFWALVFYKNIHREKIK